MLSKKESNYVECYQGASIILKFFNNSESADNIVTEQIKTNYFLPFTEVTGKLSILDLTKYIRDNIEVANQIIRPNPGPERIIGCTGTDICITSDETVLRVGISEPLTIDTIFEFYDLVSRLNQEGRRNDVTEVVNSFNYQNALSKILTENDKLVNETNKLFINMNILTIRGLPIDNLFDDNLLEQYKASIAKIADLYDHIQQLTLHKDAIKYVSSFYDDTEIIKKFDIQYPIIESLLSTVDQGISIIRDDMKYLNSLVQTQGTYINTKINKNPKFSWWWKGLPSINYIFA